MGVGDMANRPIQKWRIGAVEACIWSNIRELDNGTEFEFKTISLSRNYKKKDEDIWRSEVINNIRRNDVAKFIAVLNKAQEHLFFEDKKEEVEEEE